MSTLEPSTQQTSSATSSPDTQAPNQEIRKRSGRGGAGGSGGGASQARVRPESGSGLGHSGAPAPHARGNLVAEPTLGSDELEQLDRLRAVLDWPFYAELHRVAVRARTIGREFECLQPALGPIENENPSRPSLANLRRHAMRQWFDSVLEGREGALYERRLRALYFPILVGDAGREEVAPVLVEHFLDYVEGFLTSWLFDRPHANLVPDAQLLHAFQKAMGIQRRAAGL